MRKLPHGCPKQGEGGSRPLLENVLKKAVFFGMVFLSLVISIPRTKFTNLLVLTDNVTLKFCPSSVLGSLSQRRKAVVG